MPANELPGWADTWRPAPEWAQQPEVTDEARNLPCVGTDKRDWIAAIEKCLTCEHMPSPALDCSQCSFGQWLTNEAASHYRHYALHYPVERLHWQLNTLVEEMLKHWTKDEDSAMHGTQEQIDYLRNSLRGQLEVFLHGNT